MMCGRGPGLLLRLAEDALAENRQRRGVASPIFRPEGERMVEELRQLYARGELDRETFVEMRGPAERGELTRADLLEVRRQAAEARALESPEAREAGVSLARLLRQEKALERARKDSEATAGRLEGQIADLEAEAGRDEAEARKIVLVDEARARSFLEHRESVLEQTQRLRESIQGLRQDIQRMDDLQRQLKVQEQELEAGRARAQLGALEQQIRGADVRQA